MVLWHVPCIFDDLVVKNPFTHHMILSKLIMQKNWFLLKYVIYFSLFRYLHVQ